MTRRARASLCAPYHEPVRVSTFRTRIEDGYDAALPGLWWDRLSPDARVLITALVVGAAVLGFVR